MSSWRSNNPMKIIGCGSDIVKDISSGEKIIPKSVKEKGENIKKSPMETKTFRIINGIAASR